MSYWPVSKRYSEGGRVVMVSEMGFMDMFFIREGKPAAQQKQEYEAVMEKLGYVKLNKGNDNARGF